MDKKNVLVVGVQHSCTRLFVGFLSLHSEIENAHHWSIPSGNKYNHFATKLDNIKIAQKIIIVIRERNCVNLSNKQTDQMDNVLEKGNNFIKENLKVIKESGRLKDVIFVSFEMLEQFKEHTLRQLFRNIGVDEDNYDYQNEGTFEADWWRISLKVKDCNKKYF